MQACVWQPLTLRQMPGDGEHTCTPNQGAVPSTWQGRQAPLHDASGAQALDAKTSMQGRVRKAP